MEMGLGLYERRWLGGEPEQVMDDENLAVATVAGADADGRYVDRGGDFRHEGSIYAFYDDGESTRIGDGLGVGEEADLVGWR